MIYLALFFCLVAVMFALLYRAKRHEVGRLNEELARVQEQVDHYLTNDERFMDSLWKRAKSETARVEQERWRP